MKLIGRFIAYDRNPDGLLSNQAFPALSVNPLDVAGAGDSLLALFATGLARASNDANCCFGMLYGRPRRRNDGQHSHQCLNS